MDGGARVRGASTGSATEGTRNKVQGARDKEKKLLLLFAVAQFPLNFGHFPLDFPIR